MAGKVLSMTDVFLQWTLHKIEEVPRWEAVRKDEDVTNDAATQLEARLAVLAFWSAFPLCFAEILL
jgi:hypothetical protein